MNDSICYLLIGGTSSIIARTCTSPLELYRLQRQNSFMPGSNLRHILKNKNLNETNEAITHSEKIYNNILNASENLLKMIMKEENKDSSK